MNEENIPFHEIANIFPLMSDEDLEQLAESIKKNGLLNPIVLVDGKIIDGRNRYLACKKANIRPVYEVYNGRMDIIDYVIAQNLERRHLTSAQKAESASRALEQKRKIREGQLKQISGDKEEIERMKEAIDKKDKKNIAKKYKTTTEKIEQYEEIDKEIKKGNKNTEEKWDNAKKGKTTQQQVYEETVKTMKFIKKNLKTYKFLYSFIKEKCKELGVWDKIWEIYKPIKNTEPTMDELRKAELI